MKKYKSKQVKQKQDQTFKTKKKKKSADDIELTEDTNLMSRINWFPGHMAKAIKKVKEKLKMVDIILEIRDARAPMTSGNEYLVQEVGQKLRLIIFNKVNMAEDSATTKWKEFLDKNQTPYIFVNTFEKAEVKTLLNLIKETIQNKRENQQGLTVKKGKMRAMIIGLPNTGKSTIINHLSSKSAARTADKPGHTQSQQWIKLDEDLELLDTPGIMHPRIDTEDQGMWLSAIHAIPDHIVGVDTAACFIIRYLLEKKSKVFLDRYELKEDSSRDYIKALEEIGKVRGCLLKGGHIDYDRVYKLVLLDFRKGDLGPCTFEHPPV